MGIQGQKMYHDAQEVFEQIKLEIEQLNGEDLIKHLLIKLNQPGATDVEEMRRYEPWNLLLLVKWATLYGDFSASKNQQPVPEHVVHELLSLMQMLCDRVSEFRTAADAHLYMRKLAYQQFWLQRRESIPFGLARQYLLFGKLQSNHPFLKRFEGLTGVTIAEFIDMAVAVLHYLLTDEARILLMKEWFFAEAQAYGWNTIESFLDSISISTDDAQSWLAKHENDKSASYKTLANEYFEHSPFVRYPLFKYEGKYFVISPTLLLHSLSTFVHDELRRANTSSFMDKFGNMFEQLLDRSLRSVGLNVLTEDDLLCHFGRNSGQKVVDFLISENGCNIYVESKGVTMRWQGMVARLPKTLRNERSMRSILKAVSQAYDVAFNIQPGDKICGTEVGAGENYLLVVTMKDFFIGSGQDLSNFIGKDKIDKIIAKYGGTEVIPLKNIFFVSVDELDVILGQIAHGNWSLSHLVASAVENAHTFGGRPAFRQLVTESNQDVHPPPLLQQATDELLQRLTDTLGRRPYNGL
ncbi:MAG: hypothetical protein OXG68_08945 [Chloroflexi bacterium]|nr:hypothetical protein [Chloroflexota bacterium]